MTIIFVIIEPYSVEESLSVAEVEHFRPYCIGLIQADIPFVFVGLRQAVAYEIQILVGYHGAFKTFRVVLRQTAGDKAVHPMHWVFESGAAITTVHEGLCWCNRCTSAASRSLAWIGIFSITDRNYVGIPFRNKPIQLLGIKNIAILSALVDHKNRVNRKNIADVGAEQNYTSLVERGQLGGTRCAHLSAAAVVEDIGKDKRVGVLPNSPSVIFCRIRIQVWVMKVAWAAGLVNLFIVRLRLPFAPEHQLLAADTLPIVDIIASGL